MSKPEKLAPNKQLRGDKALHFLIEWIKYLKSEAELNDENFIINQSQLEELTGVSRKTISNYLDRALKAIEGDIEVKKRDNNATVRVLKDRVSKLVEEKNELNNRLNALYTHHLMLYKALSDNRDSFESAAILKSMHIEYSDSTGECPLCGADTVNKVFKTSNVVKLKPKNKG